MSARFEGRAPVVAHAGRRWLDGPGNSLHVSGPVQISAQAAALIVMQLRQALAERPYAILVPSVGRTFAATYALLRAHYRQAIDWQRVICVQMDEYADLDSGDRRSFAYALQHELVGPLGMGRFVHFYDQSAGAPAALPDYEAQLRALGRIDCIAHGVGRNAHLGLNEPRQRAVAGCRKVLLTPQTRRANGVDFRYGVTLGLDLLGQARASIVMLLGEEKRTAAAALLFGPAGPRNPAASLRGSECVTVLLDHAAMPQDLVERRGRASTTAADYIGAHNRANSA